MAKRWWQEESRFNLHNLSSKLLHRVLLEFLATKGISLSSVVLNHMAKAKVLISLFYLLLATCFLSFEIKVFSQNASGFF